MAETAPTREFLAVSAHLSPWRSGNVQGCQRALAPREDERHKSAWAFVRCDEPPLPELVIGNGQASEYLQATALFLFRQHNGGTDQSRRNRIEVVSLQRDVMGHVVVDDKAEHICHLFDETHRSLAVGDDSVRLAVVQGLLQRGAYRLKEYTKLEVAKLLTELSARGLVRAVYAQTAKEIIQDALAT